MKTTQMILTAIIALSATSISAMEIVIGGDSKQTVKADSILNAALANEAIAEQTLGSVRGGVRVNGDVTQTIEANTILNAAIGKGATAKQLISSMVSN